MVYTPISQRFLRRCTPPQPIDIPTTLLEVVRTVGVCDAMALDAARKRFTIADTEVETLKHRVAAASSEAKCLEARARGSR